jgi:multiple sugar transport system ATP-binding protein
MANLTLNKLSKSYPGGVPAVSDLSLDVADGELLVLVGPSGCGKTTTLRMIAGLLAPDSGAIAIGGRPVDKLAPKDRNLAMVFQNDALYPQMTVRQNMAFGLRMRKLAKAEIDARVGQAAEMLGLAEFVDRRPGELSGGERRRVALGRAVVRKPAVFLFDEPLSSLDARLRDRMRVEIRDLQRRLKATILYVTHDQHEAMTLGDRVAVMSGGVLQQVDQPAALYHEPANQFVAAFLGSPPMNFFAGRIACQAGRPVFTADDVFTLSVPQSKRQQIAGWSDRPVTLGIRPEHLGSAAAEGALQSGRIAARVLLVETVGVDTHVHFTAAATRFIARPERPDRYAVGQETSVAVLSDAAVFFDPETGARIA